MSNFGTISLSDDIAIFDRWGGSSYGMISNVEAVARARAAALRKFPDVSADSPEFIRLVADVLTEELPPGSFVMYDEEARDRRSVSYDMWVDVRSPYAPSVLDFYDVTEDPFREDDQEQFPPMPEEARRPLTWEEAEHLSDIIERYENESDCYANPDEDGEWFFLSSD